MIYRTTLCLALTVLAACSAQPAKPTAQACASIESSACPVCPEAAALQCAEPEVVEKIVTITPPVPVVTPPSKASTAGKLNLPIVGSVEWATVEPGNIRMEARIDTGTDTTSLLAQDIQLVEKDGKRWVHFTLLDPGTKEYVQVEQRLRKKIRIKHSDSNVQARYIVRMWISIGKSRSLVDVTLTDNDNMEYPLIVGRNMLVDTMIVDVSRHHSSK